MAKKKVARRKAKPTPVLSRIRGGIKKVQRDAGSLLGRARKEAVRLSTEPKRGVDRVVKEVQQLRSDLEKSLKRTTKDIEVRSRRLLLTLERDIEKRMEPLVNRLIGPSRHDVQALARRVRELEHLVRQHSHASTAAPASQASLFPRDAGSTPSSGS